MTGDDPIRKQIVHDLKADDFHLETLSPDDVQHGEPVEHRQTVAAQAIAECERAGVSMSREEWFSLPLDIRQRYWAETDWGKGKPASAELVEIIRQHVAARRANP